MSMINPTYRYYKGETVSVGIDIGVDITTLVTNIKARFYPYSDPETPLYKMTWQTLTGYEKTITKISATEFLLKIPAATTTNAATDMYSISYQITFINGDIIKHDIDKYCDFEVKNV